MSTAADPSSPETIKVLFVCLGNICRSPMAEAIFKHKVNQRGLSSRFEIDSAGTGAYHVGKTPDIRSIETCRKNGVPVNSRARQVQLLDFNHYDYILCMDNENLMNLKEIQLEDSKANVQLLGSFDPMGGDPIIKDPYSGPQSGFDRNFVQCSRCSDGFLKSLGI